MDDTSYKWREGQGDWRCEGKQGMDQTYQSDDLRHMREKLFGSLASGYILSRCFGLRDAGALSRLLAVEVEVEYEPKQFSIKTTRRPHGPKELKVVNVMKEGCAQRWWIRIWRTATGVNIYVGSWRTQVAQNRHVDCNLLETSWTVGQTAAQPQMERSHFLKNDCTLTIACLFCDNSTVRIALRWASSPWSP